MTPAPLRPLRTLAQSPLPGSRAVPRFRAATATLVGKTEGRAIWMSKRMLGSCALAAAERFTDRRYIGLEYPTSAANGPRFGHGRPPHPELEQILRRDEAAYYAALRTIRGQADGLRRIERRARGPLEPSWSNDMLPPLDAAAIYAFLREWRPRRYIEVGSGHSTKFAARAKHDGRLTTELISIDPQPRAEIDALCTRVIRRPLECADLRIFSEVEAGDVVFFDGSHRVFMNSDVTVFFLDVLPRLPPGVLVGVHDVYVPEDYPPEISGRYYSEQYLLACWLLAGDRMETILPAAYVGRSTGLKSVLSGLWHAPELEGLEHHGAAFWWRVARPAGDSPAQGTSAGTSATISRS